MEDNKFSIGDTVKFTTNSGTVDGKVIGIKSYAYVIEYKIGDNTVETIFPKSIVEAEQRSELHSVRGGNKEKIFTYYIMPSKRRQNNKKNSKKNNKSRNQRGGEPEEPNDESEKVVVSNDSQGPMSVAELKVDSNLTRVKTIVEDLDAKVDELKEVVDTMPNDEEEKSKGNEVNDDVDEQSEEVKTEEFKTEGGRRRTHKKNRNNKKNKKNRKSQRRQRRR